MINKHSRSAFKTEIVFSGKAAYSYLSGNFFFRDEIEPYKRSYLKIEIVCNNVAGNAFQIERAKTFRVGKFKLREEGFSTDKCQVVLVVTHSELVIVDEL